MILKLYKDGNAPKTIQRVVDVLDKGGVIIYPTDSMYAIGCHALKQNAVERVCRLKKINPLKNHLSIICYDLSSMSRYVRVDNRTFKLLRRNLPGPFTFILEGTSKLPKIFRNRRSLGIRMPDNAIVREIAALLGAPIMTASLPLNENEDPEYNTNPELIAERFENWVDLIIDGGEGSLEQTTVVDCSDSHYVLLRQGKGILLEP